MSNDYADKKADASGEWEPDTAGSAPHQSAEQEGQFRETVNVYPAAGEQQSTAQALLDAADDPRDVVWTDDHFEVPSEVAKSAKVPGPKDKGKHAATDHTVANAVTKLDDTGRGNAPDPQASAAAQREQSTKPAAKKAAAKKAAPAAKK